MSGARPGKAAASAAVVGAALFLRALAITSTSSPASGTPLASKNAEWSSASGPACKRAKCGHHEQSHASCRPQVFAECMLNCMHASALLTCRSISSITGSTVAAQTLQGCCSAAIIATVHAAAISGKCCIRRKEVELLPQRLQLQLRRCDSAQQQRRQGLCRLRRSSETGVSSWGAAVRRRRLLCHGLVKGRRQTQLRHRDRRRQAAAQAPPGRQS